MLILPLDNHWCREKSRTKERNANYLGLGRYGAQGRHKKVTVQKIRGNLEENRHRGSKGSNEFQEGVGNYLMSNEIKRSSIGLQGTYWI